MSIIFHIITYVLRRLRMYGGLSNDRKVVGSNSAPSQSLFGRLATMLWSACLRTVAVTHVAYYHHHLHHQWINNGYKYINIFCVQMSSDTKTQRTLFRGSPGLCPGTRCGVWISGWVPSDWASVHGAWSGSNWNQDVCLPPCGLIGGHIGGNMSP